MIKVGITGKRNLSNFDIENLKQRIYEELYKIKQTDSSCIMFNSIAAGADQLCAEIGISLGYELVCPLPFDDYRNDFLDVELKAYDSLLSKAKKSIVVSNKKDTQKAYLTAGKYVAENCDILIAVWDNKHQLSGCGTEAVVKYAKKMKKEIIVISP